MHRLIRFTTAAILGLAMVLMPALGLTLVTPAHTVLADDQPDGSVIVSVQTVDGTWGPGVITATSNVVINAGVVITIAPNTTIVVNGNYGITVNGELRANGPVTFTSSSATPGSWQGIVYAPGSAGYLDGATVEYAVHALTLNTITPVTVSNSTLRYNRHATTAANTDAFGAGLVLMSGNHLIEYTDIYSNVVRATGSGAEVYGGGVDVVAGAPRLLNVRVYDNSATSTASNGGGGGIVIRAGSIPLIQYSEITTNTLVTQANLANGGGIGIYGTTQATIRNSMIAANRSVPTGGYGGGGGIGFETSARAALIDGNVIANNLSMGPGHSEGGGIDLWDGNVVTVTNNLIYANQSRTIGGGMNINANASAGDVNVINNTVINNTSASGGGLYVQSSGRVLNNIVVGNTATTRGGGIHRDSGTVDYNDVWGNTSPTNPDIYGTVGANNLSVNPLFLGLGDLPQQYHLQPCSPAIDAGINTGVGLPTNDYDDQPRPQLTTWDIGFDEVLSGPYICKSAAPTGYVAPGQVITYVLQFGNTGAATATNVVISDVIPIGLADASYVSNGASVTPIPGPAFAWQVEDLAQDETGIITITAQVGLSLFGQTIENVAELTSDQGGNAATALNSVCSTIQCMIDAAAPGDTVIVPAGIYTESLLLTKPVSVTGVSSATVIVQAPANQRVMYIDGASVTNDVVISGMTFTGGTAPAPTYNGGGVYITGGAQPHFEEMTFTSNTARYRGGAIYMDSAGATLMVKNSQFTGNQVIYNNNTNTRGAALAVLGAGSRLVLENVQIINNTSERYGGAIAIEGNVSPAHLSIIDSVISGNTASEVDGGAIYGNLATITITHSTLDSNRAPAGDRLGGAVYLAGNGSSLTISDSTLSNNLGFRQGGAIYANGNDIQITVLDGSVLTGNSTADNDNNAFGGAVYLFGNRAELNISASTVSTNTSANYGGAIFIDGNSNIDQARLTITDSQINNNQATIYHGGGIWADQTLITVTNSTVDGNRAATAGRYGGGIYLTGLNTALTLDHSSVSGNVAGRVGAGIYASGNYIQIAVQNGSTVNGNESTEDNDGAQGGGIYLYGIGVRLDIADSNLSNNIAERFGGAVYLYNTSNTIIGQLTVSRSQINGNEATDRDGGGLWTYQTAVTITQSMLGNNRAPDAATDRSGGALYMSGAGSNLTVMTSTLTNNTASANGGGIYVNNGAAQVIIANSVISGNTTLRSVTANTGGGGLYLSAAGASRLTISDSVFANNVSQRAGGALYFYGATTARFTVTNSSLINNQAVTNNGGGLYVRQSVTAIDNTTLVSNTANAAGADGGGIYFEGATATLNNSQVLSNTANDDGGGIYSSAGTVTINDSTLADNATGSGADADGGALYVNGNTTLTRVSLTGNSANRYGGGIYRANGNVTLDRSTLADNTSGNNGGALYMAGGTLTVANSTLSGNQSGVDGGALWVNTNANLYNTTIFNNTATGLGGGIRRASAGTITFRNALVADNSPANCSGTIGTGGTTNLADDATCGSNFVNNAGSALLGSLADNGGSTWTHMLLPGNPAVDAGNNAICTAAPVNGIDQRGTARPQGANCDIGAVEATASLEVAKSAVNDGGDPLYPGEIITFAIVLSNSNPLANTNVTISDTWPAHTSYIPGSLTIEPPSAGGSEGTQPILAQGITVDAGSVVTVTYAVTVDNPLMAGTVITNTASVTSDQISTPKTTFVTGTVIVTPAVNVVKSGPANINVGETAVFTFTITNPGDTMLHTVQVVDDLAGSAGYVSGDANSDGWLDVTETWVYMASYTIQPTDVDPLTNIVSVTATDALGMAATATATHSLDVVFAPALSIAKSGPLAASVGETATFTFTIGHATGSDGSPINSVTVTDDLAGIATYISGDNGNSLLENGESWIYTASYTIQPLDLDPLTNTVTAAGQNRDNAIVTATATHSLDVAFAPALSIAKTGPSAANVGQPVVYTFTIVHDAASDGSPINTIAVTDDIAGVATYVSGDDGDSLLENGESWIYTASYTIQLGDPDPLVNTATVQGQDRDGDLVSATDTHSTALGYAPVLDVVKDGPAAANVGQTIIYTFTVSHAASSDGSPVSSIAITDNVASITTYISGDDGDSLLENSETWVYTASYVVLSSDPDPLVNTAVVTGQNTEGDLVSANSNAHSLDVAFAPLLNIVKDGPAAASIGDTASYTFTVTHAPDSDHSPVSNVSVSDDVAGAATYLSGDININHLLDAGETWTFAASYLIPDSAPSLLINTGTVTGQDRDGEAVIASDTHNTAIGSALPHQYFVFLPLVFKNSVTAPDLVVENVTITQNSVTIVIRNQGTAPAQDPFWVDLYVDPHPVPAGVNQVWNDSRSIMGAVWGVEGDAALPLNPGQSLTLTYGDAYFWPSLSNIVWPLPLNVPVYAQVDSANVATTYGAVLESHEIVGGVYNNIGGPSLVILSDSTQPASVTPTQQATQNSQLPPR